MKKRLFNIILVVALLTVFFSVGLINVSATEDTLPTYTITMEEKNENVIAVVTLTPDCAAAGNIVIQYNTEKLEMVSADKGSMEAQSISLNPKFLNNSIKANFFNMSGTVGGSAELCIIKFKLIKGSLETSDIEVTEFKLYDINSSLLSDITTAEPVYIIGCTHQKSESVITKEPTETENGEKTVTCEDCGKTYVEEIPALEDTSEDTSTTVSEQQQSQSSNIQQTSQNSISENSSKVSITSEISDNSQISENLNSDSENNTSNTSSNISAISDNSELDTSIIVTVIVVVFIVASIIVFIVLKINKDKQS